MLTIIYKSYMDYVVHGSKNHVDSGYSLWDVYHVYGCDCNVSTCFGRPWSRSGVSAMTRLSSQRDDLCPQEGRTCLSGHLLAEEPLQGIHACNKTTTENCLFKRSTLMIYHSIFIIIIICLMGQREDK
jgi:hypothetical protein